MSDVDHARAPTDPVRLPTAGAIAVTIALVSATPAPAARPGASHPYLGAPLDIVVAASSGALTYGPTVTEALPAMVALPRRLAAQVQRGRMSLRTAQRSAGRTAHPRQATGGTRPPLHCQPRITYGVGRITKTTSGRNLPAPLYVAHAAGRLNCWLVLNPVPKTGNPPALIQAAGGSALQSEELPKPSRRYRVGSTYDTVGFAFQTNVSYAYAPKGRQFRFYWFAYETSCPRRTAGSPPGSDAARASRRSTARSSPRTTATRAASRSHISSHTRAGESEERMSLTGDRHPEPEHIGRALADELIHSVHSKLWGAPRRLILDASAACLEANAGDASATGGGDRAERIGSELARQLIRAAARGGWNPDDERAAIAAAARRIRQHRTDVAGSGRWTPQIGTDRRN
jgi:hypothetical protein